TTTTSHNERSGMKLLFIRDAHIRSTTSPKQTSPLLASTSDILPSPDTIQKLCLPKHCLT
ncbi:MAG: hypothetical protein VB778_08140, partial [Nitrospinaceae bacterium]